MRKIAALLFPQFEALDMFGPIEMFGMLPEAFEICMVAATSAPVSCKQGPTSLVDQTFDDPSDYALILVPGGRGTRAAVDNLTLLSWLKQACARAEIVLETPAPVRRCPRRCRGRHGQSTCV